MNKFTDFEVSQNIKDAINDIGHDTPTLVQEKAIPALLKGDDIIILSQTGSGKTLAFGIPALESVDAEIKKPQVLIICPTRELATQVSEELKKYVNICLVLKYLQCLVVNQFINKLKD